MTAATPTTRRALDARIVALAIPALGSLIAEPLYLLIDTAIVGHLGTQQLAALGIATQVLLVIVGLCVFLAYGTTTAVARASSARAQATLGVQGTWLAAVTGVPIAAVLLGAAPAITHAIQGPTETADLAARYLRLSALGVLAQLVTIAGQGWLRGREQLRLALGLVVAAQLVNLVAELVLVYGLDLGLDGSALGTVAAQVGLAAATLWLLRRACQQTGASWRPNPAELTGLARFGGLLIVRSAALTGSYLVVSTFAARISDPAISAHQIAMQLLWLGALALDALAISAQVLVSGALGAGDRPGARRIATRVLVLSGGAGVLVGGVLLAVGSGGIVPLFSSDPAVRAAADELWPWLCGAQLIGGVVFALDGILIGAEDGRVLALGMVAAAAGVFVTLVVAGTTTLSALWAALIAMFAVRALTLGVRALRGPLQDHDPPTAPNHPNR